MNRPLRTKYLAPALLLAIIACSFLAAQEHPLVGDHPGSWKVSPPIKPSLPPNITPDERQAATGIVNQLFDILRPVPQMAPPAGFEVFPYARVTLENLDQASDSQRPVYLDVNVTVNSAPYERTPQGVDGNERDTAASINIYVNDLQPLLGYGSWQDAQGQLILNPPQPSDTLHGYPVYEQNNGDRWVMIRRNQVPFFAPVSCERYLVLFIKDAEDRVAKAQKTRAEAVGVPASVMATFDEAIAHFQQVAAGAKQEYAAMSPAQRAAPAFLVGGSENEVPKFVAAGDSDGTAIVYFNPALMNSRLPRSAPQILAIHISSNEDLWPGIADRLDKQLDWAALDKLVHQP